MAEDTDERIYCALEDIVNVMNQSKHVKNELKKMVMESVSTLRNMFQALKKDIAVKTAKAIELQIEVNEAKGQLRACRDTRATTQVAPSVDRMQAPDTRTRDTQHPPSGRRMEPYSDIVAGRGNNKKFKVIIRAKGNQTSETTKELIKTKLNPTELKVGVITFKALRDGRILIEVGSKEETERIRTGISEKCREELEALVQDLRNPRLVIYNIPEDITLDNATKTIREQNS